MKGQSLCSVSLSFFHSNDRNLTHREDDMLDMAPFLKSNSRLSEYFEFGYAVILF
jgi:hypothetical protein